MNLTSVPPLPVDVLPITDAHGTVLRSAGAGRALSLDIAVFVEDAVIVGLLVGVEIALVVVVAFGDAVLEVQVVECVHIVSLALVGAVAVPCRAPVINV